MLRLGHAKSGRPSTRQCLRYPRRPDFQSMLPRANSVLRLPWARTEAMILDRTSLVNLSMAQPCSGA
jgi:hypothetical protein